MQMSENLRNAQVSSATYCQAPPFPKPVKPEVAKMLQILQHSYPTNTKRFPTGGHEAPLQAKAAPASRCYNHLWPKQDSFHCNSTLQLERLLLSPALHPLLRSRVSGALDRARPDPPNFAAHGPLDQGPKTSPSAATSPATRASQVGTCCPAQEHPMDPLSRTTA